MSTGGQENVPLHESNGRLHNGTISERAIDGVWKWRSAADSDLFAKAFASLAVYRDTAVESGLYVARLDQDN
ncbi:hypothetical protein [Burkholderia vietnamiensis]|uniref:hypothetical protein n=1 Tax=Burkholderia vietnamiensis TaxID=60552 RepID=UPI00158FC95D|nr:hypothetical protein [Burkholderia vietnamiensis]